MAIDLIISFSVIGVGEISLEAKLSDRFFVILNRSSCSKCEPKPVDFFVNEGECGDTDATLFFLTDVTTGEDPLCLLLPEVRLLLLLILLVLTDRDAVDNDDDDDVPFFFLTTTTDKLSQLQKGHVDSFSF